MAEFSAATVERLNGILPDFARKENPVDLTGQVGSATNLFRDSLAAIGDDPRTEAVVIQFSSSGMRDITANSDVFKEAARKGFPIVISFAAETVSPAIKTEFREAGILVSDDPFNTMRALGWLYARRRYRDVSLAPAPVVEAIPAPQDWSETMDWLAKAQAPPANWKVLGPDDRAAEVCADMEWPVVVKALPSEAEHKTELGLVKLRVSTPEEVDAHAAEFRAIVGKPRMGVLVQEMIRDGVEVVLAGLRNTDFGPVLSIGSGGVAIELYRDVTYLALPATADQVRAALARLKLWTLLEGYRGQPRADVEALVRAAVSFGDMFLNTPALAEMEVNPVMVRPEGRGVAAVDCLATVIGGD